MMIDPTIAPAKMSHPNWQTTPDLPQLVQGAVHVWRASVCQATQSLDQLAETLSSTERDQIAQLRFEHHRRRSIASRGILRAILARYLHCDPAALQFEYGTYGKPTIANLNASLKLEFNLSHSHELILYAIAQQPVGIDLEFVKERTQCDRLIKRYFSIEEQAALNSLSSAAKHHAFCHYWTCKEAVLKAQGLGIFSLKTIQLNPIQESLQPLFGTEFCQVINPWCLYSFEPEPNYLASIAIELPKMQLKYWQW
jgi:4'-phosphopantetheinyl transferase